MSLQLKLYAYPCAHGRRALTRVQQNFTMMRCPLYSLKGISILPSGSAFPAIPSFVRSSPLGTKIMPNIATDLFHRIGLHLRFRAVKPRFSDVFCYLNS